MNTKEIIDTYNKTGSLRETGAICGVNWQKIRKILITEGMYESDTSIKINELHAQNKPISEIADLLKISETAVNSYLPYEKGIYNIDNPSANAMRIRKCREK